MEEFVSSNAFGVEKSHIPKVKIKRNLVVINVPHEDSWYIKDIQHNKEIKLYLKDEIEKLLKVKAPIFTSLTQKLLLLNIFTTEHYFKVSESNVTKELWTERGLDVLRSFLTITKEEEDLFVAKYYFIADAIGEHEALLSIRYRFNLFYPEEKKKDSDIKNFFVNGWRLFSNKNKTDFDKYMFIMNTLQKDIEADREIKYTQFKRGKEVKMSVAPIQENDFDYYCIA